MDVFFFSFGIKSGSGCDEVFIGIVMVLILLIWGLGSGSPSAREHREQTSSSRKKQHPCHAGAPPLRLASLLVFIDMGEEEQKRQKPLVKDFPYRVGGIPISTRLPVCAKTRPRQNQRD